MPEQARAVDSSDLEEGADSGYFAPLAPARHLRITSFSRRGDTASASVPAVVDGDRVYFRAANRSGTVKRLGRGDAVQVTPSGVLGFFTYGPPLDAIARRLSGDEASLAAAELDSRYPLAQRFPMRPLRRQAVYYELLPDDAADDQDGPAGSPAPLIIRVGLRQETGCADASAPASLATMRTTVLARPID